ncbi:putative quinol monooxygenase [uncultured Alistipes sp.]|uniref:putative quinol monooxygenase n=1 Tax=uncultured Alistipes sp. TaxID=538949 RepID=UPI002635AF3C|nr:putative quinol monooxygenase [uncultured Alistipes sp.]
MINIIVSVTVPRSNREAVLPLLEKLTAASQKENGNVLYQYYLHPTDAERLVIVEVWENAEVLAAHEATEHFTVLLPQIVELSTKLDIRKFEATPVEG